MRIIFLSLFALFALFGEGNAAPSFDCSKASAYLEQLICSNRALGDLDGQLSDAFLAKKTELGPDLFKTFLEAQRQWLKSRTDACRVQSPSQTPPRKTAAVDCLAKLYRDRVDWLSSTAKLYYSADDRICRPMTKSLVTLHLRFPHAIYLSDVRNALMMEPGVKPLPWIDRPDNDLDGFYTSETPADAVKDFLRQPADPPSDVFFKGDVKGNGEHRLVRVRNDGLGSHGDYQTTIWFLKPDTPFRSPTPDKDDFFNIDPSVVDLQVPAKNSRGTLSLSFPTGHPPDEITKTVVRGIGDHFPQEPINYYDHVYIIAGDVFGGEAAVYLLNDAKQSETVCVIAPDSAPSEIEKVEKLFKLQK